MLDRPYRNQRVVKDRIRSVSELKAQQRIDDEARAVARAEASEVAKTAVKDRCAICDVEDGLSRINVGSIIHLCPIHFRAVVDNTVATVAEMRAAFTELTEVLPE